MRKDILDLLTALTSGDWPDGTAPSLLSHLGSENAQVLLHSLAADLDNSFDDYKMKISLYDFICAVMEGKQEGLAVLFITGRDVLVITPVRMIPKPPKIVIIANIEEKHKRYEILSKFG